MLKFSSSGSTKKTQDFLRKMQSNDLTSFAEGLAQRGVTALQAATPQATGLTAASWGYQVENKGGKTTIYWTNSHDEGGVNIAVILQYGHGTGTGGYVSGRDYINPAMQPIFDQIADELWKKVTSS